MQYAIKVADKSCHCDKVNSELRSKDGVRLLSEGKFFIVSFWGFFRTRLLERSCSFEGRKKSVVSLYYQLLEFPMLACISSAGKF